MVMSRMIYDNVIQAVPIFLPQPLYLSHSLAPAAGLSRVFLTPSIDSLLVVNKSVEIDIYSHYTHWPHSHPSSGSYRGLPYHWHVINGAVESVERRVKILLLT